MGRKGGTRHLKRWAVPPFWPISVKERKWAVKPSPGPHPADVCIPLLVLIRDVLGYAKNAREARVIIGEGRIRVDGRVRRDRKFPVGIMDVVEVGDEAFRVLPHPQKGLILHGIGEEERGFKLYRIDGKTIVRGGNLQINLHDGTNILIAIKDPLRPVEDVYKRFDSLKLSIPDHEILGHIPFKEGAYAMIIRGRNMGRHGKIAKIEPRGMESPIVTIRRGDGGSIRSIKDYVFCVGGERPWISLP